MKNTNIYENLKENDLFKLKKNWDKRKFYILKAKAYSIICYLVYLSRKGKIETSAGLLMNFFGIHRTLDLYRPLWTLQSNNFIKSDVFLYDIKKNQVIKIIINGHISKCIIDLLKLIPFEKFKAISRLGYNHWAVYCYLFYKYNTQDKEYIICPNTEIQKILLIHRHTIRKIIIDLEVDGHLEVVRREGSYQEGFGKVSANLYKVLT